MRWFDAQNIKGGIVFAFNQYYKTKNCDNKLKCISKQLKVKRKFYDIIEAYLYYKNKNLEITKKNNKVNSLTIEI